MPPTLHCVRHAQGYHNLGEKNHGMLDPTLTPHGESQCLELAKTFPHHDDIDVIVASPLKRTVYTALHVFKDVLAKKNIKVIALPQLQETSDLPCDTGSAPDVLAKELEGKPVDLSLVKEGWNSKKDTWAPDPRHIAARAHVARQWLHERPEKNIAVVTHGGLLHYLTEDWYGATKNPGTGWENTEYRSYYFSSNPDDQNNATLLETPESIKRRNGPEPKHPASDEQTEYRRIAMRCWGLDGYQNALEEDIKDRVLR